MKLGHPIVCLPLITPFGEENGAQLQLASITKCQGLLVLLTDPSAFYLRVARARVACGHLL